MRSGLEEAKENYNKETRRTGEEESGKVELISFFFPRVLRERGNCFAAAQVFISGQFRRFRAVGEEKSVDN